MTPNRDPKPTWQFLLLFCLKPGGRNLTHVYCLQGGKIEYSSCCVHTHKLLETGLVMNYRI